ncbi:aspartyl-phosphate phosphatase Spo0E family protein [Clostridiaceae bacterium 35-E11]
MINHELEKILEDIKSARNAMHDAIDKEGSLLSSRVIYLSKELDKLLSEYHRIQAHKDHTPK